MSDIMYLLRFCNHFCNHTDKIAVIVAYRRGQRIETGHGANANIKPLRTCDCASPAYINNCNSYFRKMTSAVNDH